MSQGDSSMSKPHFPMREPENHLIPRVREQISDRMDPKVSTTGNQIDVILIRHILRYSGIQLVGMGAGWGGRNRRRRPHDLSSYKPRGMILYLSRCGYTIDNEEWTKFLVSIGTCT